MMSFQNHTDFVFTFSCLLHPKTRESEQLAKNCYGTNLIHIMFLCVHLLLIIANIPKNLGRQNLLSFPAMQQFYKVINMSPLRVV